MIRNNCLLQWLNIEKCESKITSIDDFIKENFYYLKSENIKNIKVRDFTGWTELLSLKKIVSNVIYKYYQIQCNDNFIIISENSLIPVYKDLEDNRKIGFHGEELFKYTLKYPYQIKKDEYVRTSRIQKGNNGFINPIIKEIENSNEYCEYEFFTKSSFINIDTIQLLANNNYYEGYIGYR